MSSISDGSVRIQTTSQSVPSTPSWFGEVVLMATHLRKHSVLTKISERIRFARRRFGPYEVIDFLSVLFGYAISGEPTLEAFYKRLQRCLDVYRTVGHTGHICLLEKLRIFFLSKRHISLLVATQVGIGHVTSGLNRVAPASGRVVEEPRVLSNLLLAHYCRDGGQSPSRTVRSNTWS